ncbi:hypothetical protein ACHWQZ_G016812 [Mnemiopsis leidyi]
MFSKKIVLVLAQVFLLMTPIVLGAEEVGEFELDEYGGGGGKNKDESGETLLECLRVKHKDSWHIRWSEDLAIKIVSNIKRMIQVGYHSKNWNGKFNGLDTVLFKVHGTNHTPMPYVCEDFRNLKYDQIRQISLRNGGAEVGCGVQVLGNSVTVLCLYRTGIDGYVPVVHWEEEQ